MQNWSIMALVVTMAFFCVTINANDELETGAFGFWGTLPVVVHDEPLSPALSPHRQGKGEKRTADLSSPALRSGEGFREGLSTIRPHFRTHPLETYETIQVNQLEFTTVSDIKWSPDGSRLAIVESPLIHILDTRTWDTIRVINDANVSSIQWSPDGTSIASVRGGFNEALLIWDVNSGEILEHFDRYEEDSGNGYIFLSRLSWSYDATRIASDSSSLDMLIWDVEDGDIVVAEGHEENGVTETDWSPDSTRIVSGGADGTVRIWNAESAEPLLLLEGGGFVDWHPTNEQIIGTSVDGDFAIVWNALSGEELLRVEHGETILSVRWNYDGTLFATGGLDGIVNIWDGQFGKSVSTTEVHSGEIITMLAWHPNQNLLASASLDGKVVISGFE